MRSVNNIDLAAQEQSCAMYDTFSIWILQNIDTLGNSR